VPDPAFYFSNIRLLALTFAQGRVDLEQLLGEAVHLPLTNRLFLFAPRLTPAQYTLFAAIPIRMRHHSGLESTLNHIPVFLLGKFRLKMPQIRLGRPHDVKRFAGPQKKTMLASLTIPRSRTQIRSACPERAFILRTTSSAVVTSTRLPAKTS
jgi:hypothetical protein